MSHHYSGPRLDFPHGDARLDLTDVFAFPKPGEVGKSILIMNVHPSFGLDPLKPTTAIPFAADAMYELRIDTNGDKVADVTYRMVFSPFTTDGQTVSLHLIRAAKPDDGGDVLIENAPVSLERNATITEGGGHRCFAGWRSDPFFFDPVGALNGFRFGKDFFADKDVCSIVLEVPNSVLGTGKNGLWARTLTLANGRWVQVDRGGRASQAVFLAGDEREHYHAAEPADDADFVATFAHSLEHTGGYSHEDAQRVAEALLPDIQTFDHTQAACYPHNGRMLTDDVMGVFLPILTNNKVMTHGLRPHDDLLADFPYLGPPHVAFAARPVS